MLKRKKLLVSCSSPGLFGLPEKLQGTVNYTVKAGLLHRHTTVAILGARAKYGKEIVRYFIEETQADRAVSDDATQTALDLAGAWSDLSWEEMEKELDRIRYESKPTPPLELDL